MRNLDLHSQIHLLFWFSLIQFSLIKGEPGDLGPNGQDGPKVRIIFYFLEKMWPEGLAENLQIFAALMGNSC